MPLLCSVPVLIVSEANRRDSWVVQRRRAKAQKHSVLAHLAQRSVARGFLLRYVAEHGGATVRLVRKGPQKLDQDNLANGCKAVQDAVAYWGGVDDGDLRLTWIYEQEPGHRIGALEVHLDPLEAVQTPLIVLVQRLFSVLDRGESGECELLRLRQWLASHTPPNAASEASTPVRKGVTGQT